MKARLISTSNLSFVKNVGNGKWQNLHPRIFLLHRTWRSVRKKAGIVHPHRKACLVCPVSWSLLHSFWLDYHLSSWNHLSCGRKFGKCQLRRNFFYQWKAYYPKNFFLVFLEQKNDQKQLSGKVQRNTFARLSPRNDALYPEQGSETYATSMESYNPT